MIHVVSAVIIDKDDRVFLQRRPRDVQFGGLWETPGGKVKPDELPRNALYRELVEELDLGSSEIYIAKSQLLEISCVQPLFREEVMISFYQATLIGDARPHAVDGQPEFHWMGQYDEMKPEFCVPSLPILTGFLKACRLCPGRYGELKKIGVDED